MRDFILARAWAAKGDRQRAIEGCRRTVASNADFLPAWRLLADLLLMEGQVDEAYEICERFAGQQPEFLMLQELCQEVLVDRELVNSPQGRLSLCRQRRFSHHRSGWAYALECLKPLHNENGTLLDGFMENSFVMARYAGKLWEGRTPPYRRAWVGFLHNPAEYPSWYPLAGSSAEALLALPSFERSLESCRGFYTLSESLAVWLREKTGQPVQALLHPTEFPEQKFDPERYLANPAPKVIQVGWWLRRLLSIFELPVYRGHEKVWLVPSGLKGLEETFTTILSHEGVPDWTNVRRVVGLSNTEYDAWLSENVAFAHLYSSSANNAVVECIARATPLLVNPLPPVVEYLGANYPLYFESLSEAAEKLNDRDLVCRAHEYLKGCPTRERLRGESFLTELRQGEIYQSLPEVAASPRS